VKENEGGEDKSDDEEELNKGQKIYNSAVKCKYVNIINQSRYYSLFLDIHDLRFGKELSKIYTSHVKK
jgi:hypothetical protein